MLKFFYQKGIKITLITSGLAVLMVAVFVSSANAGYTFATYNQSSKDKQSNKNGLELTVDSRAVYNGVLQPALSWGLKDLVPGVDHFFNFSDVKPGDMGEHTISLHVKKSDAYICLDFSNLSDSENGVNEPEGLVDTTVGGDLSQNLEFFAWRDDGDNKFEVGEQVIFGADEQRASQLFSSSTYAVADTDTGNSCRVNTVNYVGIVWCAGDLKVDFDTANIYCVGEVMGNESQTDSMSVDLRLRAVQAKYNQGFSCESTGYYPKSPKPPKGNNGHGNDEDHNDDSNKGNSNDESDNTDDDGLPSGAIKSERFTRVSSDRTRIEKWYEDIRQNFTAIIGRNN